MDQLSSNLRDDASSHIGVIDKNSFGEGLGTKPNEIIFMREWEERKWSKI